MSFKGASFQFYDDGNIREWNQQSPRISMGSIDPAAPPFKIGSSKQEVIKALGTPPVLLKGGAMDSWSYGGVTVLFYDGKVHSVDGNTPKFEEGKAQ